MVVVAAIVVVILVVVVVVVEGKRGVGGREQRGEGDRELM